jgi:hypothetical protein
MSNDERIAYFNKHIETLKTKEAKQELERKKTEKEKNNKFETTDFHGIHHSVLIIHLPMLFYHGLHGQ